MKLVTTVCADCGHEQEELISRGDEGKDDLKLEACENCGSESMSIQKGVIQASSAIKAGGTGLWG